MKRPRLIGMKPVDAIKQTLVKQGFSQPAEKYEEKLLDVGTKVRYLYQAGELEGYQYKSERRKRSTDTIWSVDVYKIKERYVQKHQPALYYLDGGPKRSFDLWVFSCGMHLAHSTFSNIINSFFKTKE